MEQQTKHFLRPQNLRKWMKGLGIMVFLCLPFLSNAQTLLAGWDFQTTTTGGTAMLAAPNSPTVINANFGSGAIYLNGTNGSSTWASSASNPELTSFGGTAVNAGVGFSTTTSGASSLSLANLSANGKGVVFSFSMSGYTNLVVSYATQKTSTGFSSQAWEYSTNGTTWTAAQTLSTIPTAYASQTLTTITGLDNATTAYLRLKPSGASAAAGNNRIDNIQLKATSIATAPIVTSNSATATVGTPFSYTISASNAPTSYASSSLPANGLSLNTTTGEISGTPTTAGTYTINLDATNSNGTGSGTLTLTVNPTSLSSQTITFNALANATYGDASITLSATASSGLPVSYSSASTNISIAGNVVTILAAGTASITATQAGDATYASATDVIQSLVIDPKNLTVTGVVAQNKVFDGTTAATLDITAVVLNTIVGSDVVNIAGTTGVFASSAVGTAIAVTSSLTLTGAQASNYILTQPTLSADITSAGPTPVLLAGWDFQTTTTGGTAMLAAPNSPTVINANFGSGAIYLNGTNTASTWATASSGNELTSFGGTAVNAGVGFSTTTSGASSLSLVYANAASNSKKVVFSFNMAGYSNLVVSYATQKTTTGFASQAWEYSTNGTTWTPAQTLSTIPSAYATQTLTTITGLNNVTTAFLRLTVAGGTAAGGNNRIDNIQLNATAVASAPVVTSNTATATVGAPFSYTISASNAPTSYASSSLPANGLSLNTATGEISGTPTTVGTYTINLDATNANGTGSGTLTLTVNPVLLSQTITFNALANATYGDASITLSATASSGLPVSYSSASTNISIAGNVVTILAAGTASITASQAGDATYASATDVIQSLVIDPKNLTVTGVVAQNKVFDGTTAATLDLTAAVLNTLVGSDVVNVTGTTGVFASSAVGTAIAVTSSLTLTGAQASNYTLTQPTLSADITSAGPTPVLLAGWDFQTTTTGGTAMLAAPNSPTVINANFGSGAIYLNGTNGSGTWASTSVNPELTSFSGTTVNAGVGFSTTTSGASSLSLANLSANGKGIVFSFSMAGYSNLEVSYATQRTTSGFATQAWEYSTNGTTWTPAQTLSTIPTAYATQTLTTITGLDNATTAYLRLLPSGATTATGNNRIDNIQLKAIAVASAPAVTSNTASATVGTAFSYFISASNAPTSYASSSLPSNGLSLNTTTGEISGTPTTAGTYTINLDATNANGTGSGTLMLTVNPAGLLSQTITFNALANATYGDAPITLTATASSGLPISYSSTSTNISIVGNVLTILAPGTASITASQAGDATYLAAIDVTQSLLINLKNLTVTGVVAQNKVFDATTSATLDLSSAVLNTLVGSDVVGLAGTGVFTSPNVGTAISVIPSLTLTGAQASYYTLTQPILTADITNNPNLQIIAAWNLFGLSSPATATATTFDANLVSSSSANLLTRGPGAIANTAGNSFRTTGFQNNGISTSNTDYFQTTLTALPGNSLSLSFITANLAGTGTFAASPGVSSQFAYSLDGTTFTLIGSPIVTVGTPASIPLLDVSSISALQNVAPGTTITIRYYASGQTTTGGWGFNSPNAGVNGLAFGGKLCQHTSSTTNTTICNTDLPYTWNGQTITAAGTYTYSTLNMGGCDSIATLVLTVNVCPTNTVVNLTCFIEGYIDPLLSPVVAMRPVALNQGVSGATATDCDVITVELHDATAPYALSTPAVQANLNVNGLATATFASVPTGSYWIAVSHRTTPTTWSAAPVSITAGLPVSYDFTASASQAFGSNMVDVNASGSFAFFSGDVDDDEVVDTPDYSEWETDANNFGTGYLDTDLDGDGVVDTPDYSIWETNTNNFVGAVYP